MIHNHGHSHNHIERISSLRTGYYVAIVLNFAFVLYEVIAGLAGNSMSLLSDAGHKFLDSLTLLLSLLAFHLSNSKSTGKYTFGLKKASVLIAFVNAVLLCSAVIVIIAESGESIANPAVVDGETVTLTAAIGMAVGIISALLLMRYRSHDINTRGAFLHLATDALISLGVLISGIVIRHTGWYALDSFVSIVIAASILGNGIILLRDSFRMIVDGVPAGFDIHEAGRAIESVDGVVAASDVHVRAVSVVQTTLTARVGVKELSSWEEVCHAIKKNLGDLGITEAVLEPFISE